MIAIIEITMKKLPTIFLVSLLLIGLYVGISLLVLKKIDWKKTIYMLCFVLYLQLLYVATLDGLDFHANRLRANLYPFATLKKFWNMDQDLFLWNVIPNLLLLMPVGILVPLIFKNVNNTFKIFLVITAVSLCIETLQYFTGRSADIDDLMLNVVGGMSTYIVYLLYKKCVYISGKE